MSILLDSPSPIPPGVIYRGGSFDALDKMENLGSARTVVNLRRGPDPSHLHGVRLLHVPAMNTVENYRTDLPEVQVWLREALAVLVDPDTTYPVYVHCSSGKDRTGLVIATLLKVLRVPTEVIIEEYLLSDDVARETIEQALAGLEGAEDLVDRSSLKQVLRTAARPPGQGAK